MKQFLIFLVFTQSFVFASFKQVNGNFDRNCQEWNFERFNKVTKWKVFGVKGAKSYGYHYEVPIDRKGVDVLWCAVELTKGNEPSLCIGLIDFEASRPFARYKNKRPLEDNHNVTYINLEEQYEVFLEYIQKEIKKEHISRPNVGVILEILSRYYLQELTDIFPKSSYKITGGVSYKKSNSKKTIGELDILVYDSFSCKVKLIGESKASSKSSQKNSLKKAKKQLQRFKNFLNKESKIRR